MKLHAEAGAIAHPASFRVVFRRYDSCRLQFCEVKVEPANPAHDRNAYRRVGLRSQFKKHFWEIKLCLELLLS